MNNGYASHADYFQDKQRKLQEQQTITNTTSCLFSGISIYVNGILKQLVLLLVIYIKILIGYTVPGKESLRTLVIKHGGRFENMLSSRVTHIIATTLAASKVRQYQYVNACRINKGCNLTLYL